MVRAEGIEPPLHCLRARSLAKAYPELFGPCRRIRTFDFLAPNQTLYPTELHTDKCFVFIYGGL